MENLNLKKLNIENFGSSVLKNTKTFQTGDQYSFLVKA